MELENSLPQKDKAALIDNLLANSISIDSLELLRVHVNEKDLSHIIQHIYDLNEKAILKISLLDGVLRALDQLKNVRRNSFFIRKIQKGFRDPDKHPNHKVILAEGDSWFNYPILLTDIIDRISMDPDLAVYSLAKGGDWLLNMLKAREYVEELSVLHPHAFLISGGGNDLVGSNRLAAIVDPSGTSQAYKDNKWANLLIEKACQKYVPLDEARFYNGAGYLSKDFFALLMFFYLQYSFLVDGITCGGETKVTKFPGIKIITQGYDYPIPSYDKSFGPNILRWYVPFARLLLGHGSWLKTPLQLRGITNSDTQKDILYAMIYLFNEMMIYLGKKMNGDEPSKIFHIDSRGSVGRGGWTDELHPTPNHFMDTGEAFVQCIKGTAIPTYGAVYVVKPQPQKQPI